MTAADLQHLAKCALWRSNQAVYHSTQVLTVEDHDAALALARRELHSAAVLCPSLIPRKP